VLPAGGVPAVCVSVTVGDTLAPTPRPVPYRAGVWEFTRIGAVSWSEKPDGVPTKEPGTTCSDSTLNAAELGRSVSIRRPVAVHGSRERGSAVRQQGERRGMSDALSPCPSFLPSNVDVLPDGWEQAGADP
jgi:hypothetical protein